MCFALSADLSFTECFFEGFRDKLDGHPSGLYVKLVGNAGVGKWQLKYPSAA